MCRLLLSIVLLSFSACITAPPKQKEVPVSERILVDRLLSGRALAMIESSWKMQQDPEITPFLGKMIQKLSAPSPFLKDMGFQSYVGNDLFGKWMTVGFAGRKFVVARGLLRNVEFENQLAAALCFELAHVQLRHLVTRVDQMGTAPARDRLFQYTDQENMDALVFAVNLMYRSGYDIRGFGTLWDLYESHSGFSPYSPALLQKLREKTREEIVQFAPVNDPIVRTNEFVKIYQRLKAL